MLRPLFAFALLLLAGCSNPFACNEEQRILETTTASPFYQVELGLLNDYREDGWQCDHDGSVRTTYGIGTRYVCTRCG